MFSLGAIAPISSALNTILSIDSIEPATLRARFFPDARSAGLLPYPVGGARVEELLFSNSEQAASILLEPATAQRLLAKDALDAGGEATVTIRGYRVVVECDHRWYLAQLVSASKTERLIAGVREQRSVEC